MLKWSRMALVSAMAVSLLTAASAEPTLESVEKELAEKLKTLKSFTADMAIVANTTVGPLPVKSTGKGKVEKLLVGEVWRSRMDMVNSMSSDSLPGAMGNVQTTLLTVFDGEVTYVEAEIMGMKQVAKKTPKPADVDRKGDAPFAKLRAQGTVKLLPEQKVGETACYVVEVVTSDKARAAKPELPKRLLTYFAKDNGLPVKSEMFGEGDKSIGSMELSNVKLNPELDPERFTYTPPPGTTVRDITDMKPGALGL